MTLQVLFCTFMAAQNIAMCNPHLEIFSGARGAAKSLFKLLERKSKINALEDRGSKPDKFKGDIVFDNIYFNYPSRPDVKVSDSDSPHFLSNKVIESGT